jgi:hypothetical protein
VSDKIEVIEVDSEEELVVEVCAAVEEAVSALMVDLYGLPSIEG